jgi:hypothetical protein
MCFCIIVTLSSLVLLHHYCMHVYDDLVVGGAAVVLTLAVAGVASSRMGSVCHLGAC